MKRKAAAEYVVEVNGTPDYAKIPNGAKKRKEGKHEKQNAKKTE